MRGRRGGGGAMTGTIDHTVINLTVFVLAVVVGYHVVWTEIGRAHV